MTSFIPEEKISEIKQAADIVDIVSERVLLKKAGNNYLGLCPFHTEKTPSFTVSPDKQIYHCFGCGAGGNVFSFMMQQEGLSFPEAVRTLARRYRIALPDTKLSPQQKQRLAERETILHINRKACDFYHRMLMSGAAGSKAREYLTQRGMTPEVINAFRLGYAPKGWDVLLNHFMREKVSPSLLDKAGLVVARKSGSGFYDRFRDRIIFPIIDNTGQMVGCGGRVMDQTDPKYLNSPETPVYNKRRCLYGLYQSRTTCRQKGEVYVVEGYFDLLALHCHGLPNVVATLGTALTPEHVRLLKGQVNRVFLVFDSDNAGIKAAERSVSLFMHEGLEARVMVLPRGHDPDTFLTHYGAESFKKAAKNARGMIPFLMETAVSRHGLDVEGKIRIVEEMQGTLKTIADPVARALYVKELAERIGIDEATILATLKNVPKERSAATRGSVPSHVVSSHKSSSHPETGRAPGPNYRLEMRIIAMMMQFPAICGEVANRKILTHFQDDRLGDLGQAVVGYFTSCASDCGVSDFISTLTGSPHHQLAVSLAMEEEEWNRQRCFRLINQYEESIRRRDKTISKEIKDAEERNDHEHVLRLLEAKQTQARMRQIRSKTLSAGGFTQ